LQLRVLRLPLPLPLLQALLPLLPLRTSWSPL